MPLAWKYDQDIFDSAPGVILTCPVNSKGVMGAGLAKAFASRYVGLEKDYKKLSEQGVIRPGGIWLWKDRVLLFATKDHWSRPSEYFYISRGLERFVDLYGGNASLSFAMPMLGCGLGQLNKDIVSRLFNDWLSDTQCSVYVFIDK